MKTPKQIFDNRYLYYREALDRPAIPLEARQLIFNVMQEYANETVKNLTIPDVSRSSKEVTKQPKGFEQGEFYDQNSIDV